MADSLVLLNPLLRQAPKRCSTFKKNENIHNYHIYFFK